MSLIPENENQESEPTPEPKSENSGFQLSAFSFQPEKENLEIERHSEGEVAEVHPEMGDEVMESVSDGGSGELAMMPEQVVIEPPPPPPPPTAPAAPKEPFWPRFRVAIALIAILICAGFFRFYGRDFDQNTHQHPDERFITGETQGLNWPTDTSTLFDPKTSPMNLRRVDPQFPTGRPYSYGSLPVYLNKAAGWLADSVLPLGHPNNDPKYWEVYDGVTAMGRMLAALFDLITILLVFLIARRLYSRTTALIAAALVAFSVTNIQIAHFYASDIFLVTFMMAALYFSVVLMQRPSWWAAIGAGLCLGLAVATKVSVIPFALIVVAAVVLRAAYRKRTRILGAELSDPMGMRPASAREREMSLGRHLLGGLGFVALSAVFAVIAFMIAEPYVLWSFDWSLLWSQQPGGTCRGIAGAWLESNPYGRALCEQAGIQGGQADVPYTRQYIGTLPIIYHLQQMVMWGLGIIPGLVGIVAFGAGLWRVLRGKPAEILLMAGALPYLATITIPAETKWMRYWLPLVPIFCILGAALLMRGAAHTRTLMERRAWLRTGRQPIVVLQRNFFPVLAVMSVGWAFLWAVAFMNIYSQNHSRIQASDWIYDNVPPSININGTERKTRLSAENWDDQVPLGRPPDPATGKPLRDLSMYGPAVTFGMYDDHPPADQELEYIKGLVKDTDYIVIASNRIYGSIKHEPWRYQVQTQFYTLLFQGKLGFQHLCSNGAAECSHTTQVSPALLGVNFDDQSADESFTVYDHPAVDVFKKTSELTDDQYRILFSASLNRPADKFSTGRHDTATDDKSLAYDQPLSTLGNLDDYAWNPLAQSDTQWIAIILWLLLAYVLGLITLPIIFTICRNLPDKGYPLAKLVGLMLVAWAVWSLSSAKLLPFSIWTTLFVLLLMAGVSALCWRLGAGEQIREFVATKRSLIIYYEALFLLTFFAFLFIRMLNPDLWHPSLGGEKTMEFGFLNSTLRSPWMPPADPFFGGGYINYYYYGQFVMAVMIKLVGVDPAIGINLAIPLLYALTFAAGAGIVYNIVAWAQKSRGGLHSVSRAGMAFGLIAGVLMLGIGNLHGIYQIIVQVNPELGNSVVSWINSMHFAGVDARGVPVQIEQSVSNPSRNGFDFWGTSRIIHHTINEFPYWSFLFADFHPHLIDMPFTMGVTGLAMNLAFAGPFRRRRTKDERRWTMDGGRRTKDGGRRTKDGGRRTKDGGRRTMDDGRSSSIVRRPSSFLIRVRDSLSWLWGEGWSGALLFGALAVMLGTLFATNTWDWPTFAGVCGGAALVAMMLAFTRKSEPEETASDRPTFVSRIVLYGAGVISIGLLVGASLLTASPFLISFKNVLGLGVRLLVENGTLPDGTTMHRTTLAEFLFFWAIFVFIMLSYTVVRLWSFPWGAAVGSIVQIFGGGRSQAPRRSTTGGPVFSPDAALSLQPASVGAGSWAAPNSGRAPLQPMQGGPQLATALAGMGGSASSAIPSGPSHSMAFSSDLRESLEPTREPGLRMGENTGTVIGDHAIEGDGVDIEDNGHVVIEDNGHVAMESNEASADLATTPESHRTEAPSDNDNLPWVMSGLESGPLNESMLGAAAMPEASYDGSGYTSAIPSAPQTMTVPAVRAVPIEHPGVIPLWAGLGLLAITAALTVAEIVTGQLLLALLVALIGGIISTTLSTSRSAAALSTGLLLVTALLVSMGVELVYLADHLQGGEMFRMNTVFKFYIQVWLLFGAGSAAAIYYVLYGVHDKLRKPVSEKVASVQVEPQNLVAPPVQVEEQPQDMVTTATAYNPSTVEPSRIQVEESVQVQSSEIEAAPSSTAMASMASEFAPATYEAGATEPVDAIGALASTNGEEVPAAMGTGTGATGPLNNWLVWGPEDETQPLELQSSGQEQAQIQEQPDIHSSDTVPLQPAPLPVTEAAQVREDTSNKKWNSAPLLWTAIIAVPVNLALGFILFGGAFAKPENILPNAGGLVGVVLATVGVSIVFAALVAAAIGFSKSIRWSIAHSAWLTVFAVFMAVSLIFTKYGTENRVGMRFENPPPVGTLDGLAFMKTAQYGPVQGAENSPGGMIQMKYDYEAIEWMKKNISGLHIIAEGPYEYYRDGGMRAASYTGLPMIVGGLHQGEQRYDWLVGDRDGQARQLFSTTDPQVALTIMSKYDVEYIYLGQLEQLRAGNGLQKFDQLVKAGVLEVAYKTQVPAGIKGTIVYHVAKSPKQIVGAPVQGKDVVPGLSFTPLPTGTPTPPPTPPTDDPELKKLLQAVADAPDSVDTHHKLVDWYNAHELWQAAASELEGMVNQWPQDITVRHKLGDAYQQMGQPDKALKTWEDARDVEPDNAAAHNKVGIAYTDRHRYDDAIKEFQTAVQKDADFNEAKVRLGEVYMSKGDKDNAKKAFQDAISHARDKDDPWAKTAQEDLNKIK